MAYVIIAFTGFLGGVSSGLFGVGGGVVFVPLLILALGFNPHLAIGTSLAAIIPTALTGMCRHLQAGMIDWKTALFLVCFAMIGAWLGADLSVRMNVTVLRRLYAVFLILIALKIFFQKG